MQLTRTKFRHSWQTWCFSYRTLRMGKRIVSIFGALEVMRMDTPKILAPNSEIICYHGHWNHWVLTTYHGATYSKSMGTDMKNVDTCRRWWWSWKTYIVHFVDLWGMKINTVVHMTYFRKGCMTLLCEGWISLHNRTIIVVASGGKLSTSTTVYTTVVDAIYTIASATTVYATATVLTTAAI